MGRDPAEPAQNQRGLHRLRKRADHVPLITFRGFYFEESNHPLTVSLELQPLNVLSWDETFVLAELPPDFCSTPGNYLAVVSRTGRPAHAGGGKKGEKSSSDKKGKKKKSVSEETVELTTLDVDTVDVTVGATESTSGGATGATEPTRPAGPAGPTGATGAEGPSGAAGPTGPAGTDGTNGTNGNDGATGPQGATGPAGIAGAMGNTGAQGPVGPTGPTGPAGADGADGEVGAAGPTGPQGQKGDAGATAPQGNTGPVGPTGPAGATGGIGPTGVAGAAGATGAMGMQGVAGPTGPTGPGMTVNSSSTIEDAVIKSNHLAKPLVAAVGEDGVVGANEFQDSIGILGSNDGAVIGDSAFNTTPGGLFVNTAGGNAPETDGDVLIDGDFEVVNGVENFIHPHPADPRLEIAYVVIEAPEATRCSEVSRPSSTARRESCRTSRGAGSRPPTAASRPS